MAASLVVGLGRSGLALARFLAARGDRVLVTDDKPARELAEQTARLPPGVEVHGGGVREDLVRDVDEVYASPGVPWDAPVLKAARRRGLKVSSEIELFLQHCPATVVGITGTNGKTTTTALTGEVLARGPRPVLLGGNIGSTVLDRLADLTPRHVAVLELSSFQLEAIANPHVHVGVVLNLTPDHLDRHRTLAAYTAAKARLVEHLTADDFAVLNGEDPTVRAMAERTAGQVVWFDRHQPDPPMPVPGRHNLMNARAAAAVGRVMGLDDATIAAAVSGFKGVEHRLELVAEAGGVRWYNDSKATNPDAARVGLASFAGEPVVLIAGGHGSGFELHPWLDEVVAATSAVILIGESAAELEAELRRLGHPDVSRAADLEQAVAQASDRVRAGGVVLLSPGYKSFDMFASYEDRGRQFRALVRRRLGVPA